MKRILIVLTLVLALITLSGCTDSNGDTTDVFGIVNKTKQTKEELQAKIEFYKERLLSMVDQPMEQNASSISQLSTNINPDTTLYSRDEMPPEYDYPYDPDAVDPEFIFMTTFTLGEFADAIAMANDVEENEFFTFDTEDYSLYLKVVNEDNQLYIESYSSQLNPEYWYRVYSVSVQIMYLNLVDDKVNFQYIRDHHSFMGDYEQHKRYYDLFIESGDMINVSVDMLDESYMDYQNYQKAEQSVFLFTNSEEGRGYNYTDNATNRFYSISFNGAGEVDSSFICYGIHNPTLSYSYRHDQMGQNVFLRWNLFDVSGWDHALVDRGGDDYIYLGSTQLLSDFRTEIQVEDYASASTYTTIPESELTESLLNLSDYGLSFDFITLEQLLIDSTYLVDHYPEVLLDYGFSTDMTANREILMNMFPFLGDEQIISDLFDQVRAELEANLQ